MPEKITTVTPDIPAIVRARREALGLSQRQAADASQGQVSEATWNVFENGRSTSFKRRTKLGIAAALGWPTDAIDRLLAGADPSALDGATDALSDDVARRLEASERRLDALEARVAELEARTASNSAPVVQLRPAAKKGRPTRHEFPDG